MLAKLTSLFPSTFRFCSYSFFWLVAGIGSGACAAAGENLRTVFVNVNGVAMQAELIDNNALLEKLARPVDVGNARFYAGRLRGYPGSAVRVSKIDGRWRGIVVLDGEMYRIGQRSGALAGVEGLPSERIDYGQAERQLCGAKRAHDGHRSARTGAMAQPLAALQAADMFANRIAEAPASTAEAPVNVGEAPLSLAMLQAESPVFTVTSAATIGSPLCANPIDGVCLLPEIEFAYDLSYQNLPANGQTPMQRALLEINELELFLQRSFNFRFSRLSVTMLNAAQDALVGGTDNAADLLDQLRRLRGSGQLGFLQKPRSIFHFVTGRDFPSTAAEGNIVGLAYLDQVCAGSGLNTGLTDAGDTPVVSLVMAHEIGHNLGALHDDETTNGCASNQYVMSGSIGAASAGMTDYSSCSVRDMEAAISANLSTSCFSFPVDVSITGDEGNPVQPPLSTPFESNFEVLRNDGHVAVNRLRIEGSINDATQGYFTTATAAGQDCSVSSSGSSFYCEVSFPAMSNTVSVGSYAYASASELAIQV
ncbi:MAG: hypothetical protein HKO71_08575, partial [Pseudomonadales bacterium]|nr:hypothetical protein [Pseudomonadales bacterium]